MIFITFEGPEGSGKSTVLSKIKEKLMKENIDVQITREPGGSVISEQIRKVILNTEHKAMDPWTEVLLYIAARQQHLTEKIFPLLQSNTVVICDRFSDSTLAYQGYGRNLNIAKINQIQELVFNNFQPNLTIFFDITPLEGLKRIKNRINKKDDRIDKESLMFHKLVYQGYKKIIKKNPQRIRVVDATKTLDNVTQQVYEIIKQKINNN